MPESVAKRPVGRPRTRMSKDSTMLRHGDFPGDDQEKTIYEPTLKEAFSTLHEALKAASGENMCSAGQLAEARKFYMDNRIPLAWGILVRLLEEQLGAPIRQT